MITPEQIAKPGTEHAHQCALFAAIAIAHPLPPTGAEHPLHWLFAIHNARDGSNAVAGAKAKAEGVKRGVPDLFLPQPMTTDPETRNLFERMSYHGCYIELKRPEHATHKNGNCSDDQLKWIRQLRRSGYYVNVAFGWHEALTQLQEYLAGTPLQQIDWDGNGKLISKY